jgi:cystathionine beta-lyase family protein involved in aluminum resistance
MRIIQAKQRGKKINFHSPAPYITEINSATSEPPVRNDRTNNIKSLEARRHQRLVQYCKGLQLIQNYNFFFLLLEPIRIQDIL